MSKLSVAIADDNERILRLLGEIVSNDEEEMKLAENEVVKTIDEINRYLDLIGDMYDIITKLYYY